MEPEDLDVLYRIENDMALWNVGCTNVPYSRYTLHNYIADNTNDIYTDKQLRLMVENDKGETVGIVDLMNFEPRHQRAELGIVIMDKYRNCGYATAAIKEVIGYARNILHIHQLFAFIDINNEESLNVLTSIGFERKAVLKDWLCKGDHFVDAVLTQYFL